GVVGGWKSEDAVAADSDVAGDQRRRAWKLELHGGGGHDFWTRRRQEGSSDFEEQRDAVRERRDREKIGCGCGGGGCEVESTITQRSLVERLAAAEMTTASFGRFGGGRGDGPWRRGDGDE
ncbi:hypothetical protein PIB30_100365, partial [Stylosanthes scabra]|nr:hypothetical protein [Stylosanthes scabra]